MKTLYFNTNDLEGSTNGEHEQYRKFVEEYASENDFEIVETGYKSEDSIEFEIEQGDIEEGSESDATLLLWDKYCAG